jgi:hypothetical protein
VYIGAPKEEDRNPASKQNSGQKLKQNQKQNPKLNINSKQTKKSATHRQH